MFEKLKRKSIERRIEKNVQDRDLTQRNTSLRTLGFLVDETTFSEFEKLYDFYKEFHLQTKDVKIFSFIASKRKLPSLRQNQITNKDFSWRGEIHNQNAKEFMDIPFDALIGFYKGNHAFLDCMVAGSNAKFKVGFSEGNTSLFDLVLDLEPFNSSGGIGNIEKFKNELKKYFEILGKV